MNKVYASYLEHLQEIHALNTALGLLGWDQETYMPPRGLHPRAAARAHLSGLIHDQLAGDGLGGLLDELGALSLPEIQAASVRESRRDRDRAVKVPRDLVTELAETTTLAQQTWAQARKSDDWPSFAPLLAKVVDLKRREAEAVGYEGEPYDALLEEYEPGATAAAVEPVFTELRAGLVELMDVIHAAGPRDDDAVLAREWPVAGQDRLSREVLRAMGFDFEAGRLDTSTHPFTSGTSPVDVRLTTMFDPLDLAKSLYSTIHEGGHGLYEQGLPVEHAGTPLGQACSLGIHESQSRLWENQVGRSRPFMDYLMGRLKDTFPDRTADLNPDILYRAFNVVRPSLIRIEADEVTYNLHVLLRFELERALFRSDVEVADLPALWNERMTAYLGVTPENDSEGVLQDIHWSFGALGYFPTYTLGNIYSATMFAAASRALPDLDAKIACGDLGPLLDWLRTNVHAHGRRWTASELCRQATGTGLDCTDFLDYLRAKFGALYAS